MPDFIPRSELEIVAWTRTFTTHVVADPERLGITQSQADELQLRQDAFDAAASLVARPETRSPVAIAQRNERKAELLDWIRRLAWFIRKTPGVTGPQLMSIGLRAPKEMITRVPSPRAAPVVIAKPTGSHSLRVTLYASTDSPRAAKPDGVAAAAIFIALSEDAPADKKAWSYHGTQTRAQFDLTLRETLPYGQSIWICARWLNAKGKAGPVSSPRQVRVTGGPLREFGTGLATAA